MDRLFSGGCSCGAVRFEVSGEPLRTGLCHCTTCRKETGSVYNAFAVWPRAQFTASGEWRDWEGRSFCAVCGSSLFSLRDDEAEVKLGSLDDAPTDLTPDYELWIKRREHWLPPLDGIAQYAQDRIGS